MQKMSFVVRLANCLTNSWKPALKTSLWLLKIMLPVSLAVTLLQYVGLLKYISGALGVVFQWFGLPGEAALAFLTGSMLTLYAAISVMSTLTLTIRELTILALMCLISHNLIIETAVQKKTGSSPWRILVLRIGCSLVAGLILNQIMPVNNTLAFTGLAGQIGQISIYQVLINWLNESAYMIFKVVIIILGLMFLQKLLNEFGLINWLAKAFTPLLKLMGLPPKTSFLWIVANTLGLAYGSAVMIEQSEQGLITKPDADLLNHHIAVSHSLLEDTLLFVAIGALALWIIIPRLIFGIFAVWFRRFELYLTFLRQQKISTQPKIS